VDTCRWRLNHPRKSRLGRPQSAGENISTQQRYDQKDVNACNTSRASVTAWAGRLRAKIQPADTSAPTTSRDDAMKMINPKPRLGRRARAGASEGRALGNGGLGRLAAWLTWTRCHPGHPGVRLRHPLRVSGCFFSTMRSRPAGSGEPDVVPRLGHTLGDLAIRVTCAAGALIGGRRGPRESTDDRCDQTWRAALDRRRIRC